MELEVQHVKFPKITRLENTHIVVSEKIDGTNGLIYISEDLEIVKAGSRNRWVEVGDDNAGFAAWVEEHKEELKKLGPGYHYGEWWGRGIQRTYDMQERVFSLFDTKLFANPYARPDCCDVVPVVYAGKWGGLRDAVVDTLDTSIAARKYGIEYDRVEGGMIFFPEFQKYLKVILDK